MGRNREVRKTGAEIEENTKIGARPICGTSLISSKKKKLKERMGREENKESEEVEAPPQNKTM